MESPARPDYEIALDRLIAKLDVIVESRARHKRGIADIQAAQAGLASMVDIVDERIEKSIQALDRAGILIERLAIKSAENEDKLNALINLMDQHINERHINEHRGDG